MAPAASEQISPRFWGLFFDHIGAACTSPAPWDRLYGVNRLDDLIGVVPQFHAILGVPELVTWFPALQEELAAQLAGRSPSQRDPELRSGFLAAARTAVDYFNLGAPTDSQPAAVSAVAPPTAPVTQMETVPGAVCLSPSEARSIWRELKGQCGTVDFKRTKERISSEVDFVVAADRTENFAATSCWPAASRVGSPVPAPRLAYKGRVRVGLLRGVPMASPRHVPVAKPCSTLSVPGGLVETTSVPGGPVETTSVPGGPVETTSVPGGPEEATAVPGGPEESTAVPGGPVSATSVPDGGPEEATSVPGGTLRRGGPGRTPLVPVSSRGGPGRTPLVPVSSRGGPGRTPLVPVSSRGGPGRTPLVPVSRRGGPRRTPLVPVSSSGGPGRTPLVPVSSRGGPGRTPLVPVFRRGGPGRTPLVPVSRRGGPRRTPLVPVSRRGGPGRTPLVPVSRRGGPGRTPLVPVSSRGGPGRTPLVPVSSRGGPGRTPLVPVSSRGGPGRTPLVPVSRRGGPGRTPLVPVRQRGGPRWKPLVSLHSGGGLELRSCLVDWWPRLRRRQLLRWRRRPPRGSQRLMDRRFRPRQAPGGLMFRRRPPRGRTVSLGTVKLPTPLQQWLEEVRRPP
ncbi:uncharacterized protein LOC129604312 [Betta splendens]|uniref:Uncharacterized protein LOC129604312 n=1 Tax=Betta splendens TaxID=158456 RepID=A0A9W2XX24_BETSP|nr:uncharacterized protein LOC129604312 [Betta splendens]XP_055366120.1 uncharacterized protein LOC129604312 [Betta splendens]XP_055366121.1 uncharacterized protein LOC129604312 [Betta splendens]XP_055366122.1 uncharacterized protein LOC129604312 [Betta splendens]XP_055366123.1 uncharacterized protein LOC129604312 [Betta splendens]XP_055366124.1 uncharacterized protein LOC129604312 [Betta splendens]